MNDIFNVGGVYDFDKIYSYCTHRVDDSNCNCNNGYICGHKDCSEACEDNENLGKCYSWSCPLVTDGADKDAVQLGLGDYQISDDIDFDEDGFSCDYEELVIWNGGIVDYLEDAGV